MLSFWHQYRYFLNKIRIMIEFFVYIYYPNYRDDRRDDPRGPDRRGDRRGDDDRDRRPSRYHPDRSELSLNLRDDTNTRAGKPSRYSDRPDRRWFIRLINMFRVILKLTKIYLGCYFWDKSLRFRVLWSSVLNLYSADSQWGSREANNALGSIEDKNPLRVY